MKKILVVEGNLKKENEEYKNAGILTHTESIKESIDYFSTDLQVDFINPSSDNDIDQKVKNINKYDGLIWGGSSLNIYNNTPEIKKQIEFMRECQKKIKKILAICWGMQVAVTAAGGEVKKAIKGIHKGIAHDIEINEQGLKHPIYQNKKKKFNTPAFNYDEVSKIPKNGVLLASNSINKVMGLHFKCGIADVWGIQYHPEITYEKMIQLIHFRKAKLIKNKSFKDESEIKFHIDVIQKENAISDKVSRMMELKNWLNWVI